MGCRAAWNLSASVVCSLKYSLSDGLICLLQSATVMCYWCQKGDVRGWHSSDCTYRFAEINCILYASCRAPYNSMFSFVLYYVLHHIISSFVCWPQASLREFLFMHALYLSLPLRSSCAFHLSLPRGLSPLSFWKVLTKKLTELSHIRDGTWWAQNGVPCSDVMWAGYKNASHSKVLV